MTYEKVIKDERGTVKIYVSLIIDRRSSHFSYDVRVTNIPPRKRTEIYNSTIATPQEILDAKTELWNLIKPTL